MQILDVLKKKEAISEETAQKVREQAREEDTSIEEALAANDVDEQTILDAKSDLTDAPPRHVSSDVPYEILRYIPEESAKHYGIVPMGVDDGVLDVGIVDPNNIEALDAMNFIAGKADIPYRLYVITESDFNRVLDMYEGLTSEVNEALSDLESELSSQAKQAQSEDEGEGEAAPSSGGQGDTTQFGDLEEKSMGAGEEVSAGGVIKEDAPVTKIVATILRYAVEGKASDIHIEPTGGKIRVRFRVDGVLNTSLYLPQKALSAVVARIKILSAMRLDEKRKPQDGRFSATIQERKIDFRVSTLPTYHGEKVVMRILDPEQGARGLDEIGLTDKNMELIQNALHQPYGMILISGPTGSGKTTTLYSMLEQLDTERDNIVSLEDPVEYNIPGVNQSQVRPEIDYTFANGLRSILRQDPDTIMVGEIRDKETAQLAIQAALTGHLVFSTIHTNSAIGVIPRLIDMGVDPYLIAPTLSLAIAQRLSRRLCPDAGDPMPLDASFSKMLDKQFEDLPEEHRKDLPLGDTFYKIKPTSECPNGTRGRIGVFEVLQITDKIEQKILESPDEDELWNLAREQGMLTMKEDAILKAFDKKIPFEEVNALGGDMIVDVDSDKSAGRKNVELTTGAEKVADVLSDDEADAEADTATAERTMTAEQNMEES
jgi:type IV pilus assembly protein PilB